MLAILPDIPRLKKPLLITGATSLATDRVVNDYENYKYAFRSVIINTYSLVVDTLRFAGDFVYTAVQNGALRNRRVVMVNEDLTSGNLFMSLIGPRLGELGFEVVNQFRIAVGTRDLSPIITQIAGTGAQTVFTFFADPGLGTAFPAAWAANNMERRAVLYGINAPLQADTVVQGLRGAATGHFLADFSAD
ncbi:MAG: ABC transporter substrate-binding protein, partial [Candidatus Bipolaricaulota bacterium]|nr:ABC transporter substrate-binding protein [Candidatus Bipolaricaulota bacterium]